MTMLQDLLEDKEVELDSWEGALLELQHGFGEVKEGGVLLAELEAELQVLEEAEQAQKEKDLLEGNNE